MMSTSGKGVKMDSTCGSCSWTARVHAHMITTWRLSLGHNCQAHMHSFPSSCSITLRSPVLRLFSKHSATLASPFSCDLPTEAEVSLSLLIKLFDQGVVALRIDPSQEGACDGNHARTRLSYSMFSTIASDCALRTSTGERKTATSLV